LEFLIVPPVERGGDPLVRRDLLPIATRVDWRVQRRLRKWQRSAAGL
jgi:hypothetical protein